MPNVVVYIKARDWAQLLEQGHDPPEYVRALVAERLRPTVTQASQEQFGTASPVSEKRLRTARPKDYVSERFSLVCSRRAEHRQGDYCPECKGDRSR